MIKFHPSLTFREVQRFIGPYRRLKWVPERVYVTPGQLDIPRVDLPVR